MENELVLEIVRLYENKRLLWDSKHSDHYNKHKREDMWREISQSVNVPVEELKKKMTSLLGSYRREKSREKKSLVTRSGQGDVYKSKWFAFPWFKFLNDKEILSSDTADTKHNIDTQRSFEETQEESTSEEPNIAETQPTTLHIYESSTPVTTSQSTETRKRKRRDDATESEHNKLLLEAFSILKKKSETPADHYETFGIYVASELRKYDTHTLPHVKKGILDVLYRADLGEYTPSSSGIQSASDSRDQQEEEEQEDGNLLLYLKTENPE